MEVGDPLLVLDRICRFYHSKAKFPTQLNELPVEKDADSLMNISTLFDQQLTVSHLARHEFLLIITDGTHGRNLVEYLYRERVFSPERRGGQKASGFYYIYPRRPHASHTANIANPRSWLPGGIPQATRNKLLESVVTLEVVTEENVMTATSIFLIELSNTSPNSVALANTLIDAILRNRATCVFLIFDHQNAKSKDLVTYMGTTASVLESGNPQNAHMFINFDDTSRVGKYTAEICNAFDSALQEAVQDRSYEVTALKQIFRAISIPKDDALLEYLLGASPNQLKPLISNLRNHNFKFDELNTVGMGHASDDDKKDSNNDVNNGMDSIMELLKTMAFNKVKHSIDKLERDIEHLHNISNRFVKEDRTKEITNFIASFQAQFQHYQKCVLLVVITAAIFLQMISLIQFDTIHTGENEEPRPGVHNWILQFQQKYTAKHWVTFYMVLIMYYVVVKLVGSKFSSMEELDHEKYSKHKTALRYLEASISDVKQLKSSILHHKEEDLKKPRRRIK